jgi:hypothetical protein
VALGIEFPQMVSEGMSLVTSGIRPSIVTKALESTGVVKDWMDKQSFKIKGLAVKTLGNLGFIDEWFRKQAARAGVERIRTLNRQLAYLTKMPLNLKDAGISDNLARLEQVATVAMEDGSMLYNPKEPDRDTVMQIVKKLYQAKTKPISVSEEDLRPLAARAKGTEMKDVFKDADMLYGVFMEFYERLKNDPRIGPPLKKSNLCVQFVYKNPSAVITIDATKEEPLIIQGDFDGSPEVTMTMNADFAHKFWHGKANLVTALTRRQVIAKGNVPKTLRLLPILNPAYDLYPLFLREKGLGHLVMG